MVHPVIGSSLLALLLMGTLVACGGNSSSGSVDPDDGGSTPLEPVEPVEPVEPTPWSGAMPGVAADCFNASLYTTSATVSLEYAISGPLSGTMVSDYTITPAATFEGQSTSKAKGTETTNYTGQPPAATDVQNFVQVDGLALNELGRVTDTFMLGANINTRTVTQPVYRDLKFTLAVGASDEKTFDRVTAISGPFVPNTMVRTTETRRVIYAGRETVSLPAGTYETCRFDITVTIKGKREAVTEWIALGSGVSVKSVTRDADSATVTTLELIQGHINGGSI